MLAGERVETALRHRAPLLLSRGEKRATSLKRSSALLAHVGAFARLTRLNSGVTSAGAAVLAAWMVEPPLAATEIWLIAGVVLALSSGGYALNDICDLDIDRINQPGRPLPSDRIRVAHALIVAQASLIAAVALALPLSFWCLGLTLVDVALLLAYAFWSKVLGALKTIIVGYLVASGFLIGAFTFDRIDPVIAILIGCAFFATMGREIVKDIQDLEGDRYHSSRTLPIMVGPRIAYCAAFLCIVVCFFLMGVPYAMGLLNDGYFGLMFLALGMSLVAWRLRQSSARLCQYMIMASSLVILVAFGIGSL